MTSHLLAPYQCHKTPHMDMRHGLLSIYSWLHFLLVSLATLTIPSFYLSDKDIKTLIDHIVRSNMK